MISFYELLGLLKSGDVPQRIRLHLNSGPVNYIAVYDGDEFNYYEIENKDEESIDNRFYLLECIVESEMFDERIEIINAEENDKIEKLNIYKNKNIKNNWKWMCEGYTVSTPQKIIAEKVNEIIDKLNNIAH